MKTYNIKGLEIYIFSPDMYGYKLVTASNGYRCRYMDYTNKEIIQKLREELFNDKSI
jgi:hypothetical protein